MNSMQLRDKLKNILREKNINFNVLLRLYMYDRFVERLAKSKYKDNFVLKGGFYLSTLFGIENRSTMDIDTLFRNANFNEVTIINIIQEIIAIDLNDNAKLYFSGITAIREDDEYGGYRIDITVVLDNIREKFHIDLAVGDPITPREISYKYKPLLGRSYIHLWAYNIETVLAEKLETLLSRVELNGRMRDFYDLYLIYTKEWNNINIDDFRLAVKKTFSKREYVGNPLLTLEVIRNSNILKNRWNIYRKKYDYASSIKFEEVICCVETLVKYIVIVEA